MTPRRCLVVRGTVSETVHAAERLVGCIPAERVAWVGGAPDGRPGMSLQAVRRELGGGYPAVVLSLHGGLDLDVLGQCHGLVLGGGALILRLPLRGEVPREGQGRFRVFPYDVQDVGTRSWDRLERFLLEPLVERDPTALTAHVLTRTGTAEQAGVVTQLVEWLALHPDGVAIITGRRGRGKSSALGQVLAAGAAQGARRIMITGPHAPAVQEIMRFAGPQAASLWFSRLSDVLTATPAPDLLVLDEAASIPVAVLQKLVRTLSQTQIIMASTTEGYEGTGRGFGIRFQSWLRSTARPLRHCELRQPIRWGMGDPLEDWVDRLMYPVGVMSHEPDCGTNGAKVSCERIDRTAWAASESELGAVFGLLREAHYRTTPSDLLRMLDAPNLAVHVARVAGVVVGACLVAVEGAWRPDLLAQAWRGEVRVRGHALAENLVLHGRYEGAAPLRMVRSVRIATHPSWRRRGVARALVDHVHQSYQPDLFGTVFGLTTELLKFRQSLGYVLVRLGSRLGVRSGRPAAVMVRPCTPAAAQLVRELVPELAWNAESIRGAWARELGEPMMPQLGQMLGWEGNEVPAPPSRARQDVLLSSYISGSLSYEAVEATLRWRLGDMAEGIDKLPRLERALLRARLDASLSWHDVAMRAGVATVAGAMRGVRRAVRWMLDASLG